eukprot:TRINITY_DN8761_c0_g1_i1.p1 TRINITY_DN8761_c0_g1~~TRINITY_DN8761_c0_g1_i1.p1  ORF type:complete len:409 (-),score=102.73 TRINITY_DN8761_c0_g1_i1:39-1226(-)
MDDDEPKRNWRKLAPMIREHIVEDEIDSTVLVDGLPRLSEDNIRRDLMKILSNDFGVRPDLLAPIPYFTKQDVWRVVFPSADDVAKVIDKTIKFRGVHTLSFVRPPVGKDGKSGGVSSSKSTSKKRKLSLEDDSGTAPPLKTLKVEDATAATPEKKVATKKDKEKESDKSSTPSSSSKKDKGDKDKEKESEKDGEEEASKSAKKGRGPRSNSTKASSTPEKQEKSNPRETFPNPAAEYAVDRIVSSRSIVGGRREYLIEAKPADSTDSGTTPLRLWFFDPELVAAVSSSPSTASSASSSSEAPAKKQKQATEAPLDPTKLSPEQLQALAPELPSLDEIDEVIGAKMIDRVLHLYVKWKGSAVASFLPAATAARLAPQKVIKFYESNLQFSDSDAK